MNTTVSYTSEPLWNKRTSSESISEPPHSRRCSTETIFSIQGRETDLLRDTTDTEWCGSDEERLAEFEPVTEPEDEAPFTGDSSGNSDDDIIATKVIEVIVGDDGELEFADSERTASGGSDSEVDFHDYWHCAQCRAKNNNPLYRYCEKCFKVRKNFFPPRPKRKVKVAAGDNETIIRTGDNETIIRTLSQDSGVESAPNSQELSQGPDTPDEPDRPVEPDHPDGPSRPGGETRLGNGILGRKRRAESVDKKNKRVKTYSSGESDSESGQSCQPLVKMVSYPALTVDSKATEKLDESCQPLVKMVSDPALTVDKATEKQDDMCIMCCSEPKSGVFVHGRIAHICCCYACARRVWARARRCPVCNCKVSNVLRAVVM